MTCVADVYFCSTNYNKKNPVQFNTAFEFKVLTINV